MPTAPAWHRVSGAPAGYYDSAGSELIMHEGQLLGGLTAGPSGEPMIDFTLRQAAGDAAAAGQARRAAVTGDWVGRSPSGSVALT
jgi:hypothetical protein